MQWCIVSQTRSGRWAAKMRPISIASNPKLKLKTFQNPGGPHHYFTKIVLKKTLKWRWRFSQRSSRFFPLFFISFLVHPLLLQHFSSFFISFFVQPLALQFFHLFFPCSSTSSLLKELEKFWVKVKADDISVGEKNKHFDNDTASKSNSIPVASTAVLTMTLSFSEWFQVSPSSFFQKGWKFVHHYDSL